MAAELYTKTGLDVAANVKRQFGDPDGRQITDGDILEWINHVQQDIVNINPILKETAVTNVVKDQDLYEYPAQRIQYIEGIHYDGVPLEAYSFQEAELYILGREKSMDILATVDKKPKIWYERLGSVYLYPKPDESITNGLRMFYSAQPEELTTLSSLLSIPDRYFPRLVEHVLAHAYQLDENWEAARYKQAEYFNGMETLANQENVSQTNTYGSITVRIEDL
jgi:hypothetical protein